VDVVAAFPADAEAFHAVIPGDGALYHPPVLAQPGPVRVPSAGDTRSDAFGAHLLAVLVVVIGPVAVQLVRALPWPAATAADRWYGVDQRFEFGDVVAVAAGQRHRQRDTGALGQQVVLRTRTGAVNRARTAFGPRLAART
jgi:hypothetical protein